jgi:urease subunit beta
MFLLGHQYGGKKIVFGFNGLVNGQLETKKQDALKKAKEKGFRGA